MGSPVSKVLEHISLEENDKLNYKGIYTLGEGLCLWDNQTTDDPFLAPATKSSRYISNTSQKCKESKGKNKFQIPYSCC